MSTQNHSHNRRSFLRMVALGAGAAVLAACGATAANTGLSDEERAALEAKGDEIAAAIAADTTPKSKSKVRWHVEVRRGRSSTTTNQKVLVGLRH